MSEGKLAVGRLKVESIRTAFPHEAHHFTVWLEANIEALAERMGIERLTVVGREKSVGSFKVDLECEGPEGQRIIIENQLETTDHDHLGKLLTYLVNLDAAIAIWVTSDPRPEHQKVIDWLNEATPPTISFYLVKAEAVSIEGVAAPLFTVVVSPSLDRKRAGGDKKAWDEQHNTYFKFWEGLLERSKAKTNLFAGKNPGRGYWIAIGAGKSGVIFSYTIRQHDAGVELFISQPEKEKNKRIFDVLHEERECIEQAYGKQKTGEQLDWQRLDTKIASRIFGRVTGGGLTEPDTWPNLQDRMIDGMIRFYQAIKPHLEKIKV